MDITEQFHSELKKNPEAQNSFSALPKAQQDAVLRGVESVSSLPELRLYVSHLVDPNTRGFTTY